MARIREQGGIPDDGEAAGIWQQNRKKVHLIPAIHSPQLKT